MPNIDVDHVELPQKASDIAKYAADFTNNIRSIYDDVTSINTYWVGNQYNELVKQFNERREAFNTMCRLIKVEIPNALDQIAVNYKKQERLYYHFDDTARSHIEIAEITITNLSETQFTYDSVQVVPMYEGVGKKFDTALADLAEINAIITALENIWKSDNSAETIGLFGKKNEDITKDIEALKTSFSSLMTETEENITRTEAKQKYTDGGTASV